MQAAENHQFRQTDNETDNTHFIQQVRRQISGDVHIVVDPDKALFPWGTVEIARLVHIVGNVIQWAGVAVMPSYE